MTNSKLIEGLEPSIRRAVENLPLDKQNIFEDKYYALYKNPLIAFVLSLFGLQYLYLRKFGKFILFVLACLIIVGTIWWIYNIVMTFSKTHNMNNDNAKLILSDIKLLTNVI